MSVDFEHERTPLLRGDVRMQFHVSSAVVHRRFGITSIDVFVISATPVAFFTQNAWYDARFFWWFSPYALERVTVFEHSELEFEAYIIGSDFIETYLGEVFGDDWQSLPWMLSQAQLSQAQLYGDSNGVVGMRPPVVRDGQTQRMRLDVAEIVRFCVHHEGVVTTTESSSSERVDLLSSTVS